MSELVKRTATGLLLLILVIGSILANSLAFLVVFFIILVTTQYEFYRMLTRAKIRPQTVIGIIIGVFLYLSSFLVAIGFMPSKMFVLFFPLLSLVFVNELFFNENRPIHNISFTLFGIFYIAVPFSLFHFMVFKITDDLNIGLNEGRDIVNFFFQPTNLVEYNYQILLGFFFLHWINDTGAYLIGVPFGKHKLFKRISPKKSWEGVIGGVIFSLLTVILLAKFFPVLSLFSWLIVSFIVVFFGTLGDLIESLLKRYLGLKDSGSFLPGHGGFLDRYDGVLFSTPIVYAYLQLIS